MSCNPNNTPINRQPLYLDDSLSAWAAIKGVNPTFLIVPDSIEFAQPIRVYKQFFNVNLKFKTMDMIRHQGKAQGNFLICGSEPCSSMGSGQKALNQVQLRINGEWQRFLKPSLYPLMSVDIRVYFKNGKYADYIRLDDGEGNISQTVYNPHSISISIYPSASTYNFIDILKGDQCFIHHLGGFGLSGAVLGTQNTDVAQVQIKTRIKVLKGQYYTFVNFLGNCFAVSRIKDVSTFAQKYTSQLNSSYIWLTSNFFV